MTVKFTNNASTTVATGINTSATSLTVASASAFPQLAGADDYCYLTIQQATGTGREVVKATALSTDTFTITRAQDGTTAGTWSAGDIVELRMTAALLTDVIDAATVEGVKSNFQYTPTAGQTVFSGADNSSNTLVINQSGLVNVYMNGVRLVQGTDYTASAANNTITLTTGATTSDIIDVEVYGNFTGQSGAAVSITGGSITGTEITATTLGASGTATLNTFVSNNSTISGGTINNTAIGGTTQAAGSFSDLTATTSLQVPAGTTAQRPSSPSAGSFRYNTTSNQFEGYSSSWGALAGSGGGGGGATSAFSVDSYTGDGSTTAYALSQSVTSENNLIVFIEGIFQQQDAYVLSGNTLTFVSAPANGNKILIYSIAAAVSGSNLNIDLMTGDGSDTTLTLSIIPVSENNTQVFIDGVYQNKDTYSISGSTLTFSTAPPNGSAVEVMTMTQTDINVPVDGTITPAKIASGDFYFDTDTLYVDATNNRVGVGTVSPSSQLEIDESGSGDATIKVGNAQNVYTTNVGKQGATAYGATAAGAAFLYTYDNDISIMSDGGTGSIKFTTGGNTQKMVLDASGNVGIGVSPEAWDTYTALQVRLASLAGYTNGDSRLSNNAYYAGGWKYINAIPATQYLMDAANGIHTWSTAASGTADATITWQERMRIDSAGRVGIGVPNPNAYYAENLVVAAADEGGITIVSDPAHHAYLMFADGTSGSQQYRGYISYDHGTDNMNVISSGTMRFYSGDPASERMRILSGGTTGFFGAGANTRNDITMTTATADSSKRWGFGGGATGSNAVFYVINESNVGVYLSHGGQSWTAHSDERIKENITDVGTVLPSLMNMRCVKYNLISNPSDTKIGFIAQDWQSAFPEVVDENEHLVLEDDGTVGTDDDSDSTTPVKAMAYTETIPLLLKAIQEQQETIEAQAAAITDLTTRLTALENN